MGENNQLTNRRGEISINNQQQKNSPRINNENLPFKLILKIDKVQHQKLFEELNISGEMKVNGFMNYLFLFIPFKLKSTCFLSFVIG